MVTAIPPILRAFESRGSRVKKCGQSRAMATPQERKKWRAFEAKKIRDDQREAEKWRAERKALMAKP